MGEPDDVQDGRDPDPLARPDLASTAPGPPHGPDSVRAGARRTTLGLAAFVVATLVLRAALPAFELDGASLKIDAIRAAADAGTPYDVLFLGSSRTWHAFVPDVFERRARAAGRPLRAFNGGLPGMSGPAIRQTLERLAEHPPPGLRWILVDPEVLSKTVDHRQPLARGVIGWHDAWATRRLVGLAWSSPLPWTRRVRIVGAHLHSWLYELASIGRGDVLVARALGTRLPEHPQRWLGPSEDGYVPNPGRHGPAFGPGSPNREHFLRRRVGMAGERDVSGELSPETADLLTSIAELTRALGAEPVFVSGPSINPQRELLDAFRRGRIASLLAFDRPDLYPELYALEARWEMSYLNHAGAVAFTEALAEVFLAEVAPPEPAR